eukprot:UN01255
MTSLQTQAITLDDIPQPVLNVLIEWFNKVSITNKTNKCIIDNMTPNLNISTTSWFVIDLDIVNNNECNRALLQQELTTFFLTNIYPYITNINVHSFSKPYDGPYNDNNSATFICSNNYNNTTTFFNVYLLQSLQNNNKCQVINWWNTTLIDLFNVNGYSMLFDNTTQGCTLNQFINEWTTILSTMPQDIVQSASCRFISFDKTKVYDVFESGIIVNYDDTKFPIIGQAIDIIPESLLNALITWFHQVTITPSSNGSNNKCIIDNMIPNLNKSTTNDNLYITLWIVKDDKCTENELQKNLNTFTESYVFLENIIIDYYNNYPPGPYDNQFKCAKNDDTITFMNVYKQQSINNKCKVLTWDHWDAPFNGKYYSMLFDSNIDGCTIEQFVAEWTIILSEMPQDVVKSAGCRPLKLLNTKVYETNKATISLAYDESKVPQTQAIKLNDVPQPVLNALIEWFNQASLNGNKCIIDNMTPNLNKSTSELIVVDLDIVNNNECNKNILQQAMNDFAAKYEYLDSIQVANFNNAYTIIMSTSVMIITLIASIIIMF